MKNFYIIHYDGMILEFPYSEERLQQAIVAKQKGSVIILKNRDGFPVTIDSPAISKILTEQEYESYLMTANIKAYVKNGSWYDKKNVLIKNEKWKEKQIAENQNKRLQADNMSEEEKEAGRKRVAEMMKESGFGSGVDKN